MTSPLLSLEPKLVWRHFDAIRQIPRPSKHEERIVEHVRGWARSRGFEVHADATGNLVVRVPAKPGCEGAPTVILQGHLDMVCEKNVGVKHDFMSDPIAVQVDGDWVRSVGTTLGSDNGLGVAGAMAVVEDPETVHGPLELLLTLDEETGLTGAATLDGSLLTGRILLNLDSEEDGTLYIGCAGGGDMTITFRCARVAPSEESVPYRLAVTGLVGGHSGAEIHENRANAIKLAFRFLHRARRQGLVYELIAADGGSKHNAIPREAFVLLRLREEDLAAYRSLLTGLRQDLEGEFGSVDPAMELTLGPAQEEAVRAPLAADVTQRLVNAVNALPHGVLAMSREMSGLVETSNNVAVVTTDEEVVTLTTSHRSSVMPALYAVEDTIRSLCELAGATVEVHNVYPGWKPNPESSIVRKTIAVYEALFGAAPQVRGIHAGLECGLLIEKVPGLDAVSFGPAIHGAHSPDEKASISSTGKFYRLLKRLLEELASS